MIPVSITYFKKCISHNTYNIKQYELSKKFVVINLLTTYKCQMHLLR